MKKQFKKITFIILTLFVVLTLGISSLNVNATMSDNGKGSWTPTSEETKNIMGMEHSSIYGKANGEATQHINLLSMKTDGYSSKLVTWAMNNNKKYVRCTLDKLAEDYEKNHPGWIVVGGINGDQYTLGFGSDVGAGQSYFYPQTYYPLIMDNESRIPFTVTHDYMAHIAFANDGTENSFVYSSKIKGFVISIIDEYKQELAKFYVDKINENPSAGQTTVWSTYMSISNESKYINQELDSTNDIYIVEKPEFAYMNSSKDQINGIDSLYARGSISRISNKVTLIENQFAIETTNQELKNALNVGTRVLIDAEYENDAVNNCEASSGFHSCHRKDNKDAELVHTTYDGNRYSRSIFGRKADGTYVLLAVDLATDPNDLSVRYPGMNFDECNATLKHYGVIEAYQQDGGGSVTSIYRDENGKFVVSNFPRDGLRSNLTGLLFVVRDPMLNVSETTYNSVTLTLDNSLKNINSTIQNVVVKHNGKEYPLVNNQVTIDGLDENTDYTFKFTYDVVKNETKKKETLEYQVKATTKEFDKVKTSFNITNISKTSFTVERELNELVKDVVVKTNETTYKMDTEKVTITDLIESSTYDVEITYYVIDKDTNKEYKRTYKTKVTTKNYQIPEIKEFELGKKYDNRVQIQYKYEDIDNIVTKAYLLCNDSKIDLTVKFGQETIRNLDLTKNEYVITLHLEYSADGETLEIVSNEIKVGTAYVAPKESNITYILDGGTNDSTNPLKYTEGEEVVLNNPTKEGYKFIGWYLNDTLVTKIEKTQTGDITLTAKWEYIPKTYKVTYNLDGGINDSSNPTTYTEGKNVTLKDATREGYTFLGWYLNDELVTELSALTKDVTLTAKWEEIKAPKKGCSCKKDMSLIVLLTVSVSMIGILLRKKH